MKNAIRKPIRLLLSLLLAALLLGGCGSNAEPDPTVPRWKSLREKAQYLTVLAEEEDFILLEECVNLEYLDLRGSTCYDAIVKYVQSHPQVEVVYTVPVGSVILSNTDTHAAIEADACTPGELIAKLKYLPNLTALTLPKTSLTSEEMTALRTAYPNMEITYSVELLGAEYGPEDTSIDLSAMTAADVARITDGLAMLPNLTDGELMKADGTTNLSVADVKQLMDAAPQIRFHYTFDLFGKTLSTADERVEFENVTIGNEGESQIRAALDILPQCTYFKLENCGLSNEIMADLRDDYPHANVVWRVSFGGQYSLMTDETTLRTVYGVENSHGEVLKYCTGLKYIDMGHNTTLTDISFVEYMPDLEIVILSGSSITNVDAFANHKKLEWLELANCMALQDISALESCDNLRFLNIAFSKVADLTPIENLPLERFLYLNPVIDKETRTAFEENHPDCWVRFTGKDPYSLGWRYNDIGITEFEYYQRIREIFDYDAVDRRVKAQEEAKRREEEAKREQEEASKQPAAPDPEPSPEPAPEVTPPAPESPAPTPTPEETPVETPAPPPSSDPAPEPEPESNPEPEE